MTIEQRIIAYAKDPDGAVAGAGWWVYVGQHGREIQSSSRAKGANSLLNEPSSHNT